MSFRRRSLKHDEEAIPFVISIFNDFGFHVNRHGIEENTKDIRDAIICQDDATSMMFRFRPDLLVVHHDEYGSCIVEVKTASNSIHAPESSDGINGDYPDYLMEVDSYQSGIQYASAGARVVVTFTHMKVNLIHATWIQDIPEPDYIYAPPHHARYEDNTARQSLTWPNARIIYGESNGGSGTPYLKIPRKSRFFMELREFIQSQLQQKAAPWISTTLTRPSMLDEFQKRLQDAEQRSVQTEQRMQKKLEEAEERIHQFIREVSYEAKSDFQKVWGHLNDFIKEYHSSRSRRR